MQYPVAEFARAHRRAGAVERAQQRVRIAATGTDEFEVALARSVDEHDVVRLPDAQALDVLDFDQIEPDPLTPKLLDDTSYIHERIGRCDYFQTERFFMAEGDAYTGNCDGFTMEIWGVLEGEAVFTWDGTPVTVDEIGWVLLPAALGSFQVEVTSDSTLIRVFTP